MLARTSLTHYFIVLSFPISYYQGQKLMVVIQVTADRWCAWEKLIMVLEATDSQRWDLITSHLPIGLTFNTFLAKNKIVMFVKRTKCYCDSWFTYHTVVFFLNIRVEFYCTPRPDCSSEQSDQGVRKSKKAFWSGATMFACRLSYITWTCPNLNLEVFYPKCQNI